MKSLLAAFGGFSGAVLGGVALAAIVLALYLRYGYTIAAHAVEIAGAAALTAATGYTLNALKHTPRPHPARRSTR